MQMPTVSNVCIDASRNVKYDFRAFRKLTDLELRRCFGVAISQKRKPKKNTTVIVMTSIGARE